MFPSGIPTLDRLLGDGGFHAGDWIGIAGEPGSMKSVMCTKIAGEWLSNKTGIVIYVGTEAGRDNIVRQFDSMGYLITDCLQDGRMCIVDAITPRSTPPTADAISRKVEEFLRLPNARALKENGAKILLIIDSLAPLWPATVKAREVSATLIKNLKHVVDTAVLTLQWAAAGHEFGWGAGHMIDVIMYTGTYYNETQRYWIQIVKTRYSKAKSQMYDFGMDENHDIAIGEPLVIKGRFKDAREAIESMKYANRAEVQESIQRLRNVLIEKQTQQLKELTEKISEFLRQFEKK